MGLFRTFQKNPDQADFPFTEDRRGDYYCGGGLDVP